MEPLGETRWTWLLKGRSSDNSRYEEAWQYLFQTYHGPIVGYFSRYAPDPGTAADWADEFMLAWVEGKLDGADPARGRFRQYLFGALRNFRLQKHRAAKRRGLGDRLRGWLGGARPSALTEDPADPRVAEAAAGFERDYARSVLERALDRLRRYEEAQGEEEGGKRRHHSLIAASHLEPKTSADQPTHAELALRFGLTEKAVERQLDQARRRLREWILAELRETVSGPGELAEEIELLARHWRDILPLSP